MRIRAAAGLLCALALLAGCGQLRWAKTVKSFTQITEFILPIEAASLANLQTGVFKPVLVYATASLEGRTITVRPAYTEKEAPEGAMMTASLMDFLRSAADDPKAEGIAINPGVPNAPFSVTLPKDQVLRLIESLKRRGFRESPAPPSRPSDTFQAPAASN